MSDKLKQTYPVSVEFVGGEAPLAQKLTAITAQVKAMAARFEKSIGDYNDQSRPYSSDLPLLKLSDVATNIGNDTRLGSFRSLDIANIARLIGPSSKLNPHEFGINTVVEVIPTGVHQFATRYPVNNPSGLVFSNTTVYNTKVASAGDLNTAGEYYIDSYGRISSVTVSPAGSTITYEIDPSEWGSNFHFNTIPDIAQLEAGGDALSTTTTLDGDGRYVFVLPEASHATWNNDQDSVTLETKDPLYGQQITLSYIAQEFSTGDRIPDGFCILKNYTTNAIYPEATYWYSSPTEILVGNVDLDARITAGDKFYLVTVGTDITGAIDDLRRRITKSGDRTYGQELISINALEDILAAPGARGQFCPSENPSNFAPQYLHRDGYIAGTDDTNMNDGNAMRGDIVLGKFGASAGAYAATGGTSYKLAFGTPSQAYIRYNSSGLEYSADQHTFDNLTIINEGLRLEDAGETSAGIEGTGYLRFPHFIDSPTGSATGYESVKSYHWSSFNFIRFFSPSFDGYMSQPVGLGYIFLDGNTTGDNWSGLFDLAQLPGTACMDSDGASAITKIEVQLDGDGAADPTARISSVVYHNTSVIQSEIIEKDDDGYFEILSTANSFKIVQNETAKVLLSFTAGAGEASPRLISIRITQRHKYLTNGI